MLGLGLLINAGLRGCERAAATGFDVVYTWLEVRAESRRETLLQGLAVVSRWSWVRNRQYTTHQQL